MVNSPVWCLSFDIYVRVGLAALRVPPLLVSLTRKTRRYAPPPRSSQLRCPAPPPSLYSLYHVAIALNPSSSAHQNFNLLFTVLLVLSFLKSSLAKQNNLVVLVSVVNLIITVGTNKATFLMRPRQTARQRDGQIDSMRLTNFYNLRVFTLISDTPKGPNPWISSSIDDY